MPRVPFNHRVQRYHPPLVMHARFSPERLFSPEPLSKDIVFPPEPVGHQPNVPVEAGTEDPKAVLIPKPRGEVTRLKREGYNLLVALGWRDEEYYDVQTFVQSLATQHLQIGQTFPKQDPAKLQEVYEKARERFPVLKNYREDWATADFLRVYLKNSSVRKSRVRGVTANT